MNLAELKLVFVCVCLKYFSSAIFRNLQLCLASRAICDDFLCAKKRSKKSWFGRVTFGKNVACFFSPPSSVSKENRVHFGKPTFFVQISVFLQRSVEPNGFWIYLQGYQVKYRPTFLHKSAIIYNARGLSRFSHEMGGGCMLKERRQFFPFSDFLKWKKGLVFCGLSEIWNWWLLACSTFKRPAWIRNPQNIYINFKFHGFSDFPKNKIRTVTRALKVLYGHKKGGCLFFSLS